MGSNLLYKASIVTTPTAYGVGVLNSIKPAIPFGEELVVNGSFSNGTTNWTANSSTLSVTNNSLKVLSTAGFGNAEQNITVVAGQTYLISANFIYGGSVEGRLNAYDGSATPIEVGSSSDTTLSFYITISSGQTNLRLRLVNQSATTGVYNNWDNVSVKQKTDADFDFTRTSSATRVNPDYLIETVSINSANLVQNGNFSELSSELVTNGDFKTDTDWTKGTGWNISGGKANCDGTQVSNSIFYQNINNQSNKTVKFSFTISDYVSGVLETAFFGASGTIAETISANGNYTFYVAVQSGHNGNTGFTAKVGFIGSIDNVSVKQVDPNDNWTLGTGWSFGDGVAISDGTTSNLQQFSVDTSVIGKKYKISLSVSDYSSGFLSLSIGGYNYATPTITGNGEHTRTLEVTNASSNDRLYIGSSSFDGSITNVSVIEIQENGVPRLDYTNGTASILLEPQSTNLIPYSEDFSQWNKQGSTLTVNQIISPDGNTKGSLLQSTSTSVAVIEPSGLSLTIGVTYTYAVFVKKSNSQWIRLAHISSSATGCWFDLENGVVGIVNSESAKIDEYPNGWYRISNTFVATSVSTSNSAFIGICDNDGSTNAGAIGQNVYIYGAQLEALSYPTSYIPTSGQSGGVTRAAETLNNAANSDLINSTEGVLYAEISALANDSVIEGISISDGTINNRVVIFKWNTSNSMRGRVTASGVNSLNQTFSVDDIKSFNKIAISYAENNFAIWLNGVEVFVDTSGAVPVGLNKLQFDSGGGDSNFYGKCKTVAVFKEALSDTELACLTSTNNREIFLNYYYRMQYVGANTEAVNCAQIKLNV